MVNEKLLKEKFISNGMSIGDVAKFLGINPSSVWRKIKGSTFNQPEIEKLIDLLHLSSNETNDIF